MPIKLLLKLWQRCKPFQKHELPLQPEFSTFHYYLPSYVCMYYSTLPFSQCQFSNGIVTNFFNIMYVYYAFIYSMLVELRLIQNCSCYAECFNFIWRFILQIRKEFRHITMITNSVDFFCRMIFCVEKQHFVWFYLFVYITYNN